MAGFEGEIKDKKKKQKRKEKPTYYHVFVWPQVLIFTHQFLFQILL